ALRLRLFVGFSDHRGLIFIGFGVAVLVIIVIVIIIVVVWVSRRHRVAYNEDAVGQTGGNALGGARSHVRSFIFTLHCNVAFPAAGRAVRTGALTIGRSGLREGRLFG